jgi:type VI secretion system protein ImpI
LPIRIGRNGLNDYVIGHGGVSSFHARVDDVDGRLCVTDLASKNGVLMMSNGSSGLIRPNQPVDLQPAGFQFFLGVNVRLQIAFDELREPLEHRGALSFSGHVLGNAGVLLGTPGQMPSVAPPPPMAGPVGHFQPALSAPGRPPSSPPGIGNGPGGRAATGFLQGQGHSSESMALQGLRELAASLVPGVPLESTGDIARFITKLHDALDAFCRSFIPLREGHAQFMSSLDLQRSRGRSQQRSQAYLAVESARDPEALAAALLNPKDRSFDAPQAVEGILADLMLHQLALLEGVMRGVRALLEELSPNNVEHQAGGGISLNRHKVLWNKYQEIFENVSEERQAFSLIFGSEFTAAYRQYRQTGGESR